MAHYCARFYEFDLAPWYTKKRDSHNTIIKLLFIIFQILSDEICLIDPNLPKSLVLVMYFQNKKVINWDAVELLIDSPKNTNWR